jgi:ribose transport system permease protein
MACLAGIAVSALVGGFSALMITLFRVPPFIATLAMMQVASGLAFIVTKGESLYDIPESFTWLGRETSLLSLPNSVVLMLVLYALSHILMTRTVIGRYIYAVGGNAQAARYGGININRTLAFVYVVSGLVSGLGGVIMASQLKAGAPIYGQGYELYVIAAAVVGGTSLSGGEGRIFGTLIGAFIIAVIRNGMNLMNVESYTQKVVLGLVILGAVLIDMLRRRRRT